MPPDIAKCSLVGEARLSNRWGLKHDHNTFITSNKIYINSLTLSNTMFVLNFFQLSPKYLFTFDLYESGSNQGSHTDLVGMPQSINTDFFFSLMVFIGLRNWITGSVEISPSGLSRLYPCDIIWHVSLCLFFPRSVEKVLLLSYIWLSATPWTVSCQAPLSMEFSRQEYRSELPFPSPGNRSNPGSKPGFQHCRQILYHLSHQGSHFHFLETGS